MLHSLAIEFQYLQRRREIENSAENAGNDNSVAAAAEVEQIQRQPPPRRSPEIIDCLNLFMNKTLSVIDDIVIKVSDKSKPI